MCGAKPCSIFWTFLYFMSGMMMVGIGIWFAVDDWIYDTVVIYRPEIIEKPVPWRGTIGGLLAVGSYCFLVGILGMAGAACDLDEKIKNSMIAYQVFASFGCVGVLVFSSFATAKYAMTDEAEYVVDMKTNLRDFYIYNPDGLGFDDFSKGWDVYQMEEECCAVTGYNEYKENFTFPNGPVPWSCCQPRDVDEPVGEAGVLYADCIAEANKVTPNVDEELYTIGCEDKHWELHRRNQVTLMAMGWTSVGVQLAALIATGCLKKDAMD